MFYLHKTHIILVQLLVLLAIWPEFQDCLIITSVIAGDKKFKTISFDSKFLKPLTFESELPLTEFRRHRTLRPPKFDIDVNIPIKLPIEEEYPYEDPKKPVESNLYFSTGDLHEPSYPKRGYPQKNGSYKEDIAYGASSDIKTVDTLKSRAMDLESRSTDARLSRPSQPRPVEALRDLRGPTARLDSRDSQEAQQMVPEASDYSKKTAYPQNYGYQPEFVPGGFVNLQLSGPSGGPKMTYHDYDREKWAQQLSQAPGAMPVPILNYQQLQNYYGGLGTFTNGLPDSRYENLGLIDLLKSSLSHFTSKLHG